MTQIPEYQTPPTGGNPAAQVNGPALGLIIIGSIYVALSLLSLLLNILGTGMMAMGDQADAGQNAVIQGALGVGGAIFGIILGGLILFGGLKMRKLESYNISMAGAIAAMLPCSCCCVAGLPIGIWALIVLLKPEVKAAFRG